MPGVRLHHPELRNVTFTIENYAVPLKAPMFCWSCSGGAENDPNRPRSIVHTYKTFHLNIDQVGDVVVSEEIYEMMKRTGLLGDLSAKKEILVPEAVRVEMGKQEAPVTYSQEHGPRS